jgi:putative DNA primase/helicase
MLCNRNRATELSRNFYTWIRASPTDEKAEDFAYADDPEFSTIRRKLARWASDNVRIIKDLKPPQPPDFNNRLNANWKLLLQIAQRAGGGWPEQACRSAIYLSRAPYEPSVGVQLLAALRAMFTKNRTEITSEQVVQELAAHPDSPWLTSDQRRKAGAFD